MRLIKYTHACVRLEDGDRVLLIDPGDMVEASAYEGVDDILVTHEHYDHVDMPRLVELSRSNSALRVHTHPDVVAQLTELGDAVTGVNPGDRFTAAGFDVQTVGGLHAEIYDGLPGCANVGFIVDGNVYHPGDSFFVPDQPVQSLLIPVSGPWYKLAEALDFARAIKPARAFPIHDFMISDAGKGNVDRWIDMKGETDYSRVAIGDSVTV